MPLARIRLAACALAAWGALGAAQALAAQRVYVASYGNDANAAAGCVLSNPCRSFTAALAVVDAGGEIVALDAAGYGTVVIQKSVTITANPGFFAGIAAATPSAAAVLIDQPGVEVTLRNLNINGTGAGFGVVVIQGATASIENCVISNFTSNGIFIDRGELRLVDSLVRDNGAEGIAASNTRVSIAGATIVGNGGYGIDNVTTEAGQASTIAVADSTVADNFGGAQTLAAESSVARTTITRSSFSNNLFGISSETNETLTGTVVTSVGWSQVTGNEIYGLVQFGTAVLESLGNNHVRQNGTNVSGTVTPVPGT